MNSNPKRAGAAVLMVLLFCPALRAQQGAFPDFSISSAATLLSGAVSTAAVVGRGGNYAVALPEGGALWLLNNIWLGEVKAGGQAAVWGIVDGAAALSRSSSPYEQASAAYIKDENGWPLELMSDDMKEYTQVRKFRPRAGLYTGDKYCVFYSVLNNYGPDLYDQFRVGQGLACAQKPGGPYNKVRAGGSYSLWNDIEPAFGSAVLAEDGWVYVYGRAMNSPGDYSAALARVRPADITDRAKYSYYTQDGSSTAWSADIAEASPVMEDMPEEFSVSYNALLKNYLAVYTDEESGAAAARTAPYPWGPWSAPVTLLACAKEDFCGGAKEQPAFSAADGRTLYFTLERKNVPYLYELIFK